jgi:hypothetical protein
MRNRIRPLKTQQPAKRTRTQARDPLVQWDNPLTPPPWTVEPHTPARDLWTVRTSLGLVIGPIFGKINADTIARAPRMLAVLQRIKAQVDALNAEEIISLIDEVIG